MLRHIKMQLKIKSAPMRFSNDTRLRMNKLFSVSPKSEFSLYFNINNRNPSLSKTDKKIFYD